MSYSVSPPYNFLIFDAAKAEKNLDNAKRLNLLGKSLYLGDAEENLADVAPYLFPITANTDFSNWFLHEGWNQSWGILLFSNTNFEETYRHFRKFLMVQTEDGKQLYFRFYDPRVLRIFLPTCNKEQIVEFFGPVKIYICEHEHPDFISIFSHKNGELIIGKYDKHLLVDHQQEPTS